MLTFICYPRCTTCQKAQKWLDEQGIEYTLRDIKNDNPTLPELTEWYRKSGLPLRRFFNTSGMLYREMDVKAQLDAGMSDDDALALLATNGMLVKRPVLVLMDDEGNAVRAIPGFKEPAWEELLCLSR